jgi:hypothetical protein
MLDRTLISEQQLNQQASKPPPNSTNQPTAPRHPPTQTKTQVKARLRSKDSYQDLLKTLNMYASDIINRTELLNLAKVGWGGWVGSVAGGWGRLGSVGVGVGQAESAEVAAWAAAAGP